MLHAEFDLQAWNGLEAAWQQAPQIVREELVAATWEAELLFEGVVKEFTPTGATELLRASIAAQPPQALADQVIGVTGTSLDYAVAVELGTKPHFPPVEALEDWVRHKLGVSDKEVRNVAFLVARKIAAHGTPAFGMFHRGFNKARGEAATIYERARNRIAQRLAPGGAR